MYLHWQGEKDAPIIQPDDPDPPTAFSALGTAQCHGMGCAARTGIPCTYVDRRGRPCPTSWCPSHRAVFDDAVYCALHEATVRGLLCDFGDSPHPAVDNRIPAIVSWISRTAEDDIVATLQSICRDRREVLVSDPVRRVLLGHHREGTWERGWKTCSPVGVSARVSIAVEVARPDYVLAKVNSKVIARLRAPHDDIDNDAQPEVVELLLRQLVMPIASALDCWRQGKPMEAEQPAQDRWLTGERAPHPTARTSMMIASEIGNWS